MTWKTILLLCSLMSLAGMVPSANAQTQMQIYGAWHCYTDGCSWASVPNMTTFDTDNHWMIDRNMNNTYEPSVNLVVLSFVDPVKLMNLTTDSGDTNGIPVGMIDIMRGLLADDAKLRWNLVEIDEWLSSRRFVLRQGTPVRRATRPFEFESNSYLVPRALSCPMTR